MAANNTIRKLEKLELLHLRQLTSDLHDKLERAQEELEWAQRSAEFWNEHALQLQEALCDDKFATHRAVGITKTGETMVIALS